MKPKYQVIYADPPWHYENYSNQWHKDNPESRWVGNQYETLRVNELCLLPVKDIADHNCALFLWSTPPCLLEALKVISAWGFVYKTKAFCWTKTNRKSDSLFWGMGYWTRSNTEDCLLATRGNPKRISASIHQVIQSPIQEHSHKPLEVRDRVTQLMGDVPRLEMFATEKADGWDSMGNAIDGRDIRIALAETIALQSEGVA